MTLPTMLGELGYTTALIGKAHLQPCLAAGSPEAPPRIYDFDHFRRWHGPYHGFGYCELAIGHTREPHAAGMHYGLWLRDRGVDVARYFGAVPSHVLDAAEEAEGRWALPEGHHNSRWTADRVIARLERTRPQDGPFFLWASFQDPHMPFVAPSPWFESYEEHADLLLPAWDAGELDARPALYRAAYEGWFSRLGLGGPFGAPGFADMDHRTITAERARRWIAAYYAMISLLDRHVGRVLDALDALDLSRETLVIFTSDHGELLGRHGLWGKGPFHLEDILRVPFVVRWPGVVPAGRRSSALQSLADVVPTCLAAVGAPPRPGLAGADQWAVWTGREPAIRRSVPVENRVSEDLHLVTLVTDRHKLTVHVPGGEGELYDLEADPSEAVNLWGRPTRDELTRALFCELLASRVGLGGPIAPRVAYA